MRLAARGRLFWGASAVLTLVLAAAAAHGTSVQATAIADRARTATDKPDDLSGPQVHFMYVVPADGTDNQLDSNGMIEQAIARIQHWMLSQTGNQGLRVDTDHGVPDITFFRLPHTDAQATSANPWPLWVIGQDLVAAGFDNPNKVYAAFYDGHSTWACGGATSPALRKLGAMYLQGWPTHDPAPCHAWGTGISQPGYFDLGILHEVLHAIGFAPPCAPHLSRDGYASHVNDSPTDLMYAPDATHTAPWDVLHAVLDYDHDDYYKANIPGCPDFSNSPYLQPMAQITVTVSGAGAVTSSPAGISCPTTCTGVLPPPVTLTATPAAGAIFTGWVGGCTGVGPCTLTGGGDVAAGFAPRSEQRTISLRIRAHVLKGIVGRQDTATACRAHVAVVVERRIGSHWAPVRRVHTNADGQFSVTVAKGRRSYRARAPAMTTPDGQTCLAAISPIVATR